MNLSKSVFTAVIAISATITARADMLIGDAATYVSKGELKLTREVSLSKIRSIDAFVSKKFLVTDGETDKKLEEAKSTLMSATIIHALKNSHESGEAFGQSLANIQKLVNDADGCTLMVESSAKDVHLLPGKSYAITSVHLEEGFTNFVLELPKRADGSNRSAQLSCTATLSLEQVKEKILSEWGILMSSDDKSVERINYQLPQQKSDGPLAPAKRGPVAL